MTDRSIFGTGWSAADLEALQACINNERAKQQLGSSESPIEEEGPSAQGEEASEQQDPPSSSTGGQAGEEKATESEAAKPEAAEATMA